MNGPQARHGEHGNDCFGNEGHIDNDPIALTHTQAGEQVGRLFYLGGQLGIGDVSGVAGLPFEMQRHAIPQARCDMAIKTVIGDVQGAIIKPLSKRWVGPI